MLFSSPVFLLVFLPLVLAVYYLPLHGRRKAQNLFLLLASLGFYAWGEPWFVLVMLLSILVNFLLGLCMERTVPRTPARRAVTVLTVGFNLTVLFIFKYLIFTLSGLRAAFGVPLPVPQIALPIGISFFTFQAMSYVLDIGRGRAPAQKNPLRVGLYISFFPQLIAGPIVKYETVAAEIDGRRETWTDFSAGICRFAVGFSKKVLLANTLAVAADTAFDGGSLSVGLAWIGSLAYTFQIYFDFSGYSDMAIGLGRMFGFHFLENFDYPYISRSVTEFWRRWHISLSTWFRDYVYFPLGGSRVRTRARRFLNLFAVWLLTGIWHGANWTFVVWGLYYFALLTLEKSRGSDWKDRPRRCILPTFLLVNFGWVLFRAASLPAAVRFFCVMFGIGADGLWGAAATAALRDNRVIFALAALFSTPFARRLGGRRETQGAAGAALYTAGLLAVSVLAFAYIAKGAYNPFIYFNF